MKTTICIEMIDDEVTVYELDTGYRMRVADVEQAISIVRQCV
jgi:hypothetical protein